MFKKYIKIPVEIEAVQYTGTNFSEIENFVKLHVKTEIAINIEITEETYDKMQRRIVFYNIKSDGKLYMEKGDFIANENNSIKLYNSEKFFKTYKEV